MISYRFVARVSALALLMATAAAGAADDPLAAKFGARQTIRDVSLSPEGKQAVIVGPRPDGGENALVISLAPGGAVVPIFSSKGRTEQITWCQFVTEARVVCQLYLNEGRNGDVEQATRLVSLAADGSEMKLLSAEATSNAYYNTRNGGSLIDFSGAGDANSVLMTRWFAPEVRTGSIGNSVPPGLAVEQVDVNSIDRRRVEAPREAAVWYATDGHGNVRLMGTQPTMQSGYAKRVINYFYRPLEGGSWTDLSSVTIDAGQGHGFQPIAVDPVQNLVYGFDDNGGYQALFQRTLDGSNATSLVLGRDGTDIDSLIRIGRNRRIVGVSYATDHREVEYFDPELKRLSASLARAIGGGRVVDIVDSNQDESKLLIYAGSDTDPGKYYLFDKATRQLGELFPVRPELAGVPLGEMRAVQYPAADGTMIPAYLTVPAGSDGKNLPAIVMPHGGPSSRDEWGFDWLSQYFVSRGYAVLQPNYRGSSGYGDRWQQTNAFYSWETAISDVNAAGRWLSDQGIAAPGKLAIFGWSYGGYAALQSQVLDPDLFKAVVAVAPVTDLDRLKQDERDQVRRLVVEDQIGSGPHIDAGSPARHAAAFRAPVLLFHGDTDTNVNVAQSRLMDDRLKAAGKTVTYVEFDGLDHQLDDAAARTRLLSESDRFIRTALGL
jgi:dipeptidyl aminopeptidase/acylaminoacyl peptidase